jgi:hypothetical protein
MGAGHRCFGVSKEIKCLLNCVFAQKKGGAA